MNRKHPKRASKPQKREACEAALSGSEEAARLSGRRLWVYRLGLAVVAPLLILLVIELGLRLLGIGHPTSFFLPASINGQPTLIQNDRFTWSFFGRDLARQPFPFALPEKKAKDTIRIFVLGESAAYGDPQPEFGLPRMLEALLSVRYPSLKFEVVNAAMTAINSHAIVRIARDCVPQEADFWVVYMGNNEVVGPFGAGTVFGAKAQNLTLVRAGLALKETRAGQLLDDLLYQLKKPPPEQREWGGMGMFLNNRVRQDASQMERVYANFRRNLEDTIEAGRQSGANVLVGTVACNLKDCAPFGSLHRENLSSGDLAQWERLYKQALEYYGNLRFAEAKAVLGQAARLDDTYAELHYVWGRCHLALDQDVPAREHFVLARDRDVLRFRADSQINGLIRQAVSTGDTDKVQLVDCENVLALQSPHGIAGKECLYEHVHLNFPGNYVLARTFAETIAAQLPAAQRLRASGDGWPSLDACARRLAWTAWSEREGLLSMAGRLSEPPFAAQFNHQEMLGSMRVRLEDARSAALTAGLRQAKGACEGAVATAPGDWVLLKELAAVEQELANFAGAAESWRRILQHLPHYVEGWQELGRNLAEQHRDTEATDAFEQALKLEPKSVTALTGLAQVLVRQDKKQEAIVLYEQVLRVKPYWGPAHLGLGKVLQAAGQKEAAERHFRQALESRLLTPRALRALANFCFEQGWLQEACTNLADAVRLDPTEPLTRVNLGITLSALGRREEAAVQFTEAVRLDPNSADAHVRLGLELGRKGQDAEALRHFAEAVRLQPAFVEARLNLGIALVNQHREEEALGQFQEVLRQQPTNSTALKYIRRLSSGDAVQVPSQEIRR